MKQTALLMWSIFCLCTIFLYTLVIERSVQMTSYYYFVRSVCSGRWSKCKLFLYANLLLIKVYVWLKIVSNIRFWAILMKVHPVKRYERMKWFNVLFSYCVNREIFLLILKGKRRDILTISFWVLYEYSWYCLIPEITVYI